MWQEHIDSLIERSKNTDYKMTEPMQRRLAERAVKPARVPFPWRITLPLMVINTLLFVAGGPQLAIAVSAIAALALVIIRER
jgi:hypothetical protein